MPQRKIVLWFWQLPLLKFQWLQLFYLISFFSLEDLCWANTDLLHSEAAYGPRNISGCYLFPKTKFLCYRDLNLLSLVSLYSTAFKKYIINATCLDFSSHFLVIASVTTWYILSLNLILNTGFIFNVTYKYVNVNNQPYYLLSHPMFFSLLCSCLLLG